MKKIKNEYDEWVITCNLCEFEWEVHYEEESLNPECLRCGCKKCKVIKEDPEIVKKRGRVIGCVEYDPIKDEFGDVFDRGEDDKFHKRK